MVQYTWNIGTIYRLRGKTEKEQKTERRNDIQSWKLRDLLSGETVDATVPGDITYALYKAGVISSAHYGENHKQLRWIAERNFMYTASFDTDETILSQDEVYLEGCSRYRIDDVTYRARTDGTV